MRKYFALFLLLLLIGCSASPEGQTSVPTPTSSEPFFRETAYLETAELHTLQEAPGLVFLHLTGDVPTACHQASATVCPACSTAYGNLIQVNLYAMIENGRACDGPPEPFDQDVPLGTFSEGIYVVTMNGQYVGAFDGASFDTPVDMRRDNLSLGTIDLIPPGANNAPAKLIVQGILPTACHVFKADVSLAGKHEIRVTPYSLVSPDASCTGTTQKFTSEIPLGALEAGAYSVWVNEAQVGEFVMP